MQKCDYYMYLSSYSYYQGFQSAANPFLMNVSNTFVLCFLLLIILVILTHQFVFQSQFYICVKQKYEADAVKKLRGILAHCNCSKLGGQITLLLFSTILSRYINFLTRIYIFNCENEIINTFNRLFFFRWPPLGKRKKHLKLQKLPKS